MLESRTRLTNVWLGLVRRARPLNLVLEFENPVYDLQIEI
jgi:hypothetical protein